MRRIDVGRWVGELRADVRYALRAWRRQPGLLAVAVLSLAAGIGLNTTVFSIINTVFLQSIRGVPAPDDLVTVGGRVTFATFRDVRDNSRTLAGVAAWQPIGVDIRVRDLALRRAVPAVSAEYFAVLGVRPALGRFFDPVTARQPDPAAAVVLDHEFWTKTLGADPALLGETLTVNGVRAEILGVAPREFHGFGPERPPLWMTMGMVPAVRSTAPDWEAPGEAGWRVFGRLRDGAAPGEVTAELRTLALRSPHLFPQGPLDASTGRERWSGASSPEKRIEFLLVVVVPLVVVALILWIGCSNVANLLLARAAFRRKEIAIRLANGATRARVIRLLLTESLLLALAGGAAGLMLGTWTMDLVWVTLPEAPRLAVELDGRVLLYTFAVCLLATLFFGLFPALHATNLSIAPLLKGEVPGIAASRGGTRVRTFFLVTQFACSTALLIVSGTFVKTVIASHSGDRAALLDHAAIAYLEIKAGSDAARAAYWQRVREEIQRVPGVVAVTLVPAATQRTRLVPEGSDAASPRQDVSVQRVDPAFFGAASLPMVAGRDELHAPGGAVDKAVVNERAARQFWGTTAVVGKRFALGDVATVEVTAVVRDEGAEPRVFRPLADGSLASANLLIRTATPSERAVESLRAPIMQLSQDRAFTRISTLREASTAGLERITALALAVGLLALSLATVGLYGSISFITSQRTKEIAIRMAIGAPRAAVLRLLAREGITVVACGSAAGLALTAVAFQFMSGMIFARWSLDPATVAGVLASFAAATLTACYLPGRRALRIDPMQVLRAE